MAPLEWIHKEKAGYEWYECYFRNNLIATIFPEVGGWVWRIEKNKVGIPFHQSRENMVYLYSTSAQQVCEAYIRRILRG